MIARCNHVFLVHVIGHEAMEKRVYNFSPGPAVLPLPALEEACRDAWDEMEKKDANPGFLNSSELVEWVLEVREAAYEVEGWKRTDDFAEKLPVLLRRPLDRFDFEVDGKPVLVVAPKQEAPGRPWAWHGEFFGHKPNPDLALRAIPSLCSLARKSYTEATGACRETRACDRGRHQRHGQRSEAYAGGVVGRCTQPRQELTTPLRLTWGTIGARRSMRCASSRNCL